MTVLEELEGAIQAAAERTGPKVIGLGQGWGRGSGFVVGPGRILTNAHNLRGEEVTVTFADGRRETGRVLATDQDLDLAVIEADTGDIEPIEWADDAEDSVPIGRSVLALANPGGRGLRVTPGFVSATARSFRGPRGRRVSGAIEHSAPLPRGSSGGPLIDGAGRLLGINAVRADGGLILASVAVATLGIAFAWRFFGVNLGPLQARSRPAEVSAIVGANGASRFLYRASLNKWWFDDLNDLLFIQIGGRIAYGLWWFDRNIVDGAVNGTGRVVSSAGGGLRRIQTGRVQNYALGIAAGLIVVAVSYLFLATR